MPGFAPQSINALGVHHGSCRGEAVVLIFLERPQWEIVPPDQFAITSSEANN
jgi:hypothetical protein